MKTIMKRALALVLVASTLIMLATLVSCGGTTGAISEFLTADCYTFKAGNQTVKVDRSTVYTNNGVVEKYLYYSKEEQRYFYCEINTKSKKINKYSIDSEEYILYHEQMVATVGSTTKLLSGFLQISHMLEENEGVYKTANYTVKEANGVITCEVGKSVATISDIGITRVSIPAAVINAQAI